MALEASPEFYDYGSFSKDIVNDSFSSLLAYQAKSNESDFSVNFSSSQVMESLYSESLNQYRSYGTEPKDAAAIPQFTQILWKSSSLIGVGCGANHHFDRNVDGYGGAPHNQVNVVIAFDGIGNVPGYFAANVLPPNNIKWWELKVIVSEDSSEHFAF